MAEEPKHHPLLRASERPDELTFSHPLNPNSEMRAISLSEACGLERIGVHVFRLPPGRESCIYHTHTAEEEFFYILSGKGIAEIDGQEHEVGPGDFMGFTTPSVGHNLKNPFGEDLVYLVGGERKAMEFGRFPRLGKALFRLGRQAYLVDESALEPFRGDES